MLAAENYDETGDSVWQGYTCLQINLKDLSCRLSWCKRYRLLSNRTITQTSTPACTSPAHRRKDAFQIAQIRLAFTHTCAECMQRKNTDFHTLLCIWLNACLRHANNLYTHTINSELNSGMFQEWSTDACRCQGASSHSSTTVKSFSLRQLSQQESQIRSGDLQSCVCQYVTML